MKSFVFVAIALLLAIGAIAGCGGGTLASKADTDGDGVPDELEVAGYYWKDGEFVKWDGDPSVPHYFTDPTQFSTDQDPYGDGMEVSGVKMDTSVAVPGNHPLVPACPDVYVSMSGYDVIPKATIQSSKGGSQQDAWSNAVTNESSMEHSWSLTVSTEATIGPIPEAKVSVSSTVGGRYVSSHQVTGSTSAFSQQDWTEATTTDPSQAAKIKLRLQFVNLGTAAAQNIIPTISLMLEGKTIATYKLPEDSMINVLAVNQSFPQASDWVVGGDTESEIVLTLDELKSIQMGVPLFLEVAQMQAGVLEQDDEGKWQLVDTWANYQPRIDGVCARLSVDLGSGDMKSYRVFARSQNGPTVTLRDALSWTVGYADNDGNPQIMGKPVGDWRIGFSQNAFQDVVDQLEGAANGDLLNVVIDAGWDISIKAPSERDTPEIVWAYAEEEAGSTLVAACVVDDYQVSQVLFKSTADAEGQEMTPISGGAGIYTLQLSGYGVTAEELIEATNDRGKTSTKALSLPLPPTVAEGDTIITSKYSNKCVSVEEASLDNRANVSQQFYAGDSSQTWVLQYLGDGYYKITNKNSGKVLEVTDGRTDEYVNVQQNAWTDSDYQKWRLYSLGGGYFKVMAKHSNMCLDVVETMDDGGNIRQATYQGLDTQKWVFQPPETYPSVLTDYYTFQAKHSEMMAEVSSDSPEGNLVDGAFVSQNDYIGGHSQQWELRPVGEGYFNIVARHSGKYLGFSGTDVGQYSPTGGDDQKWKFVSVEGVYYEIVNKQTNLCLYVESGSTAVGAKVLLREYAAEDYEKWTVRSAALPVRVTIEKLVCTMSGDEGPGNDADMDRFRAWANAFDRLDVSGAPYVQINPVNQFIWNWSTSGEVTVYVGYVWNVGQSIDLSFDAGHYDFAVAKLDLALYGREYDSTSANEEGTGYLTIYGEHFFDNGGLHIFQVSSSDFRFDIYVVLTRSW
jgi:hypothetical protein